ncbi:MAG: hypothetical protein ACQEW5_28845 [Bacillota bacterium]
MSALMLSTVALPAFANAQNSDESYFGNLNSDPGVLNVEVDEDIELELRQVDYFALFGTVSSNLGINQQQQPGEITTYGLNGMGCKNGS